jgi:hypothetical protein
VLRTNAPLGSLDVTRRERAVEQVKRVPAVLDALAKHIYDAPPGDLAPEPGQGFAARGAVVVEVERSATWGCAARRNSANCAKATAYFRSYVVGVAKEPARAAKGCPPLPCCGARQQHAHHLAGHGGDDQSSNPFSDVLESSILGPLHWRETVLESFNESLKVGQVL